MITDLNKILVEWAYRTNDGQPNSKNSAHVIILEKVLNDFGWSREAIVELLNNLVEKTLVKNKKSGAVYLVKNVNDETHDVIKKDASEKDIRNILSGHLCRCTGYQPIIKAAIESAKEINDE